MILAPPVTYAVVCDEPLAAAVGEAVLRDGGNAVDGAVATALALAVVQPAAGNLGGGGFLLFRPAKGKPSFLDFRETAPAAARRDMYADRPEAALDGLSGAATPGSPAGLYEAWRRRGSLTWPRLVEPAIRLAEGFPVSPSLSRALAASATKLKRHPEAAKIYLPGGAAPAPGEILRLPALAAVMRRMRDDGAD